MCVCVCVCVSVPNRWTDMVLLYNVASQIVITILGAGTTTLQIEIAPRKVAQKIT